MKEVTITDIRKIEDRELRWLARYEMLIAWSKTDGLSKAAAAWRAQIDKADREKAIAEMRIAQVNVLQTVVAQYDGKAVRDAQIADVAAQHRTDASDRQRIQEACDEVLGLSEGIDEDEIDDILQQVSKALGIELPTAADRADICQRGHKTIEQLKKDLGPSVWDLDHKIGTDEVRQRPEKITRQWILDNVIEYDAQLFDWLDKHYPEAEDGLDEEIIESARQVVCDPFDAGKSLDELKPARKIDERMLNLLLDWHESAVKKLALQRPTSAFHGSSDLYLEGLDALRYAVEDHRKMIVDYVLGRENLAVTKALFAT